MSWPDIYLLCFAVGVLWAAASLIVGGLHLGHFGHAAHVDSAGHAHVGAHGHAPVKAAHVDAGHGVNAHVMSMLNPSCLAVFLAWFGGVGYMLTRYSGLAFWANVVIAIALGLTGAWLLASFLRFLQAREKTLDAADYEMVGVLGKVTCGIRPDGVGELIYARDGARKATPACSDDGTEIPRGCEVIVTRYEKGIAYVRTWEAMNQGSHARR